MRAKTLPPTDYPCLKPQAWRPNKPCPGCGSPPEEFVSRVDLYYINPARASMTWSCPECSTLLGVLLNLICGPLEPGSDVVRRDGRRSD